MRGLAGLDINGLWDRAAVLDADAKDGETRQDKDAGIAGSVISLEIAPDALVAGAQAAIAPHGRGQGWGALGHPDRRIGVASCLAAVLAGRAEARQEDALRALVDHLAGDSRMAVLAVPDTPAIDEAARDRLLRVIRTSTVRRPLLLWRPVAAILGWLVEDPPPDQAREGVRIAVLSLMHDRARLGDAVLVVDPESRIGALAPERARPGLDLTDATGAFQVSQALAKTMASAPGRHPTLTADRLLETSRGPWLWTVGVGLDTELVRLSSGSWERVEAAEDLCVPPVARLPGDHAACARLAEADVILVEGPAAGNADWAEAVLLAAGVMADDARVCHLSVDAAANGCLEAALRMERGEAAYFDFLPQIEINALVRGEPAFVPLIPKGKRLKGGEWYRDVADGEFALAPGATCPTFYVIKESSQDRGRSEVPRRAVAELPESPEETHGISVSVEQQPGQGFATIRIGSQTFLPLRSQPVELDWLRMEEVAKTREEILAELRPRHRAYPEIAHIPGHAIFWHPDFPKGGDLRDALRAYRDNALVIGGAVDRACLGALRQLRERLSKGGNPAFIGQEMGVTVEENALRKPLGTDGTLPPAERGLPIPPDAESLLDACLAKAADEFVTLVGRRRRADADAGLLGDLVGFATWCFWRCPEDLVDRLLPVYGGESRIPINATLLGEGIGRTIRDIGQATRYFDMLGARLDRGQALRQYDYAAMRRILGGIEDAAARLPAAVAESCLREADALLDQENRADRSRAYKTKFKSVLLMLAVLLRYRQQRDDFLAPDTAAGRSMLAKLDRTRERLTEFAGRNDRDAVAAHGGAHRAALRAAARRLRRAEEIVQELANFIQLEGRDPNIIRKIEDLSDG